MQEDLEKAGDKVAGQAAQCRLGALVTYPGPEDTKFCRIPRPPVDR